MPTPTATEIDRLVKQLSAESAEQRDAAEAALISVRSAEVLERLPAVDDQTSEELRLRLIRIRSGTPVENAGAGGGPVASKVTLTGTILLSEALQALGQQTANQIEDLRDEYGGGIADPTVTVDFAGTPYLEALDGILDQAGLKLSAFSGAAGSLAVVNRDEGERPVAGRVAYDGVFRVEATRVEAIRDLANPNNQVMRLDLMIGWEPEHVPMTFQFDPAAIVGTFDTGESAKLREQVRPFSLPVQEAVSGVELNLPFELPPRTATRLQSLKGSVAASFPGARRKLEFADLAGGTAPVQKSGGVSASVERARRDGPIIDVILLLEFDSAEHPLSRYRGWVFQIPATMVDGSGEEFEYVGLETMFQRESAIALAYKFEVGGDLGALKLQFDVPSFVVTQQLRFELNNIALP